MISLNPIQIDQFSDSLLETLLESDEEMRVSLITPVQHEPDKRVENHIRLKNLLLAAETELASLNYRRPISEQLLAPAKELLNGNPFQAINSPGLAIYLAPGFAQAYQLPFVPEEEVTVSRHFLIKPLMPLRENRSFFILALSQNAVRLLKVTRNHIERVDLQGMPQNLGEALRWDDPERELQWHTKVSSAAEAPQAATFYGHGVGTKEAHKQNLRRYFQLLDQGISKLLTNENAPLVLAGVDYLLPIYRQSNSYGYLIEEYVIGSHEHLSDAELQRQAWPLVQPHYKEEKEQAISLYQQRAGKALASTDLPALIRAAYRGRIDTLFVATDEQIWGHYDSQTDQLELHSQSQPGDSDLLNLATIYTVRNGGDVYASPREAVPDKEPAAAIFRF